MSKVGAKPKHNFEKMQVGEVREIPNGLKISSLRVMLCNKGKDHGMKFSVDSREMTFRRVK